MIKPADELLSKFAPLEIWKAAEAQALRSSMRHHRTGCVIYYGMGGSKNGEIYSTGCSHSHDGGRAVRSIHAEAHAISRLHAQHGGAKCLIVTLTKANNYASCSRPCYGCAKLISDHCWSVIYSDRTNDGGWAISEYDPN